MHRTSSLREAAGDAYVSNAMNLTIKVTTELDKPATIAATIADAIGWGIASHLLFGWLLFGWLLYGWQYFGLIKPFDKMFTLNADIPWQTEILMAIGDPWIGIIWIFMVVSSIAGMVLLKNPRYKVLLSFLIAVAVTGYLKFINDGIFMPINEIQKAL